MTEENTATTRSAVVAVVLSVGLAAVMAWTLLYRRPPLVYVGLEPAIVRGIADASSDVGLKSSVLIELKDGHLVTLTRGPIVSTVRGTRLCVEVWKSEDGSAMQFAGTSKTEC